MLPKRRKPTSVGEILVEEFLKPLIWSSRDFTERLGGHWKENMVDDIIKGKVSLTEKMAKDFSGVLGTSPEFWLRLQDIYLRWEEIQKQNEKGSLKPWKRSA